MGTLELLLIHNKGSLFVFPTVSDNVMFVAKTNAGKLR